MPRPTGTAPRLLERERELASLSEIADQATVGHTRLALVTGESGIGKSSVARAFAASVPQSWTQIWVDDELTAESLVNPMSMLLSAAPAHDERLDPSAALGQQLRSSLRSIGQSAPVLLVVEDLQFLDPTLIEAFGVLLDDHAADALMVIATYRLGARPIGSAHAKAVAGVLRRRQATEVRLLPLSFDGTCQLAASVGYATADEHFYRRSGGNPFVILASVHSADSNADPTAPLVALSDHARRLAQQLALAGRPLTTTTIGRLDPGAGALEELRAAHLVLVNSDQVRLRHGLVADVVLRALDAPKRSARHRELAAALTDDVGLPPEIRARHLAQAGQHREAALLAVEAAERLTSQFHNRSAVELYDIALSSTHWSGPERAALLERAIVTAARAGVPDRVHQWRSESRSEAAAGDHAEVVDTRFSNPLFQRIARDLHRKAGHGPELDEATRAAVSDRIAESHQHLHHGRWREAATAAHDALATIGGSDDILESDAWFALGYAGDPLSAIVGLEALAERAAQRNDVGGCASALARVAVMNLSSCQLDTAVRVSQRSLRVARTSENPEFWGSIQAGTASLLFTRGELQTAKTLADELQTLGQPIVALLGQAVLWMVSIDQGDVALARHYADVLIPVVRAVKDRYFTVPMLTHEARTLLLEGRDDEAAAVLDEVAAEIWSPVHDRATEYLATGIETGLRRRDAQSLLRYQEQVEILARNLPGPGAAGLGALADAAVTWVVHSAPERAVDGFAKAAESLELAGRRQLAVFARLQQLLALQALAHETGSLDLSAFDTAIGRADRVIERFGITLYCRQLAMLRDYSATIRPGNDVLSVLDQRERLAVERAAAGASNREIATELYLAEKTVRNLLSGAYAKLGVQRRSQLAGLLRPA